MSRRPRLTGRGQVFLALGVVVVVLGTLLGYPDITRAGVLAACLPLLAVVVGWRPVPPVSVQRRVDPALVGPDQEAHVELTIRGPGNRLSPLQVAEEEVDPLLGRCPRFFLPRMDPGERHTVRYRVSSPFRGAHRLGPLRLERRDPFGMTTASLALAGEGQLLVLPRIEPLGPERVHGGGLGREGQIPHMVALHGEDDVSIRAYRDGDDLRRVHWPTTAHRGELMVRQEDRPARRRAVLVLDSRATAYDGAEEAFEWAVRAVASVAVHLADDGYAVHVVGAGKVASPQLVSVLRALAIVEPTSEDLTGAVREAHTLTAEGAVVVAVVSGRDPTSVLGVPSVRSPGSLGVALVLDTTSFAEAGSADDEGDGGLTHLFTAAGWRTRTVTDGDAVADAWATATQGVDRSRSGLAVGRP
ncbi:DUF58 domain-containing protein [Georgenia sp. H159]|uniref:DUF58 domain-containing protein n=1 Tax=Georgenia sp. H159 TaxID=3076115 RepID=UPI002D78D18F|nr:DUF58 domain-containing protein [Georgenia sp. H159]